jgi:hypothetical protein
MNDQSTGKPRRDIHFTHLPELSWEQAQRRKSLQCVADYAANEAEQAIEWYLKKKAGKRAGAQTMRMLAIIATAAAAIIPLLAEIFQTDRGEPAIAPAWASVALLLAAAAVGFDRFFGYSTAWMRFLTTEMQLRHALHSFLLDWEIRRAACEGNAPGVAEIEADLKRCKEFLAQVNEILRAELDTWVYEFSAALADIDRAAKAQAEVMRTGAVTVTVTNGDQCEAGWRLAVDGGTEETYRGKSAALRNLTSGSHTVTVRGRIDDKDLHAEKAFGVASGQVPSIELTLA